MKTKIRTFPLIFLLVLFIPLEAQVTPTKIKVVTEQANIRLRPDIGSVIIQQVPKGTILESWEKSGEWYKVKIEEEEPEQVFGYIHESLIMLLSPLPSQELEQEIQQEVEEKESTAPTQPPFVPPSPPPTKTTKPLFDLYLSGGGSIVSGGEINAGAQGLADFYGESLAVKGTGDVKPIHLGLVYGAELSFPLRPNVSIGLGGDYFRSDKTSRVEFTSSEASDIFMTQPKIQALSMRTFLSFYPTSSFYLKTGLEYYFARAFYFYRFEREISWEEWKGEAEAQDFGFLGGIGFEWKLLTPLHIVIEALGRYAKIKGFKGENTYRDSSGSFSTEKGKLYFYQGTVSGDKTVPLLFIRETEPSEPDVSDLKEATLNLSGFSLKVGIKIRF